MGRNRQKAIDYVVRKRSTGSYKVRFNAGRWEVNTSTTGAASWRAATPRVAANLNYEVEQQEEKLNESDAANARTSAAAFFGASASFSSVASSVGSSGQGVGSVGAQLVGGFQSGFSSAFGAGAALSHQILSGVLSPLGQTGNAITQAGDALTKTVGQIFDSALSGIKGIASLGGQIAGTGAGLLLGGAGAAIGSMGGPEGALLGAAIGAAIGSFLGKAVGDIGQFFGTLVAAAGSAIGHIGELFGELGKSLVSILGDVAKTVADVGHAVLHLQAFGYSPRQAGSLVQTLGFFGQSPNQVSSQFGKPFASMTLGMRAAALGLPNPTNDIGGFLQAGAARQSAASRGGAMSAGMFQSRLSGAGLGEFTDIFALGAKRIKKMLDVSRSFQVGGANLGELGGDVTMATNVLGGLGTQFKLVFAETLLPLLPLISNGFAYIVRHRDDIAGAIRDAGHWLVEKLPPLLLEGAARALDVFSGFLSGFSVFVGSLAKNSDQILGVFDAIINGFGDFVTNLGVIVTGTANLLKNAGIVPPGGTTAAAPALKAAVPPGTGAAASPIAPTAPQNAPRSGPSWGGALKATAGGAAAGAGIGAFFDVIGAVPGAIAGATLGLLGYGLHTVLPHVVGNPNTNTPGAYAPKGATNNPAGPTATASLAPTGAATTLTGGVSNLAGNSKIQARFHSFLTDLSQNSADASVTTGKWASGLRQKEADWPKMLDSLKKIEGHTKGTEENTKGGQEKLINGISKLALAVQARVSAEIAEDFGLGLLSSGGS